MNNIQCVVVVVVVVLIFLHLKRFAEIKRIVQGYKILLYVLFCNEMKKDNGTNFISNDFPQQME